MCIYGERSCRVFLFLSFYVAIYVYIIICSIHLNLIFAPRDTTEHLRFSCRGLHTPLHIHTNIQIYYLCVRVVCVCVCTRARVRTYHVCIDMYNNVMQIRNTPHRSYTRRTAKHPFETCGSKAAASAAIRYDFKTHEAHNCIRYNTHTTTPHCNHPNNDTLKHDIRNLVTVRVVRILWTYLVTPFVKVPCFHVYRY